MDTWQEIEALGFYPELVGNALRRACGGLEPRAMVAQVEAAFDRGSMFRHLTMAALTDVHVVSLHVDEAADGGALVSTTLTPVTRIRGASILEVVPDAARPRGARPTEVTVSVDLGAQRRAEAEPLQCDDPECTAEHGWGMTSVPDDFTVRVSALADGPGAMARAEHFVDVLTSIMGGGRG